MQSLTYSHINKIVYQIPESKLNIAYNFLIKLTKNKGDNFSDKIPLNKKHKLMKEQAQKMISHYKATESERLQWQSGDFLDEY